MDGLVPFIEFYKQGMSAVMMGGARMMGLFLFFPLFTWAQFGQSTKSMIAYAFAIPNIVHLYFAMQGGVPFDLYFMLSIMLKELAIGVLMGFALGAPFWAVQAAGDVVELYRGASASNLFDPINAAESSLMGQIYSLMGMTLFVMVGGIPIVIDIMLKSYSAWPTLQLVPDISWGNLQMLGRSALHTVTMAFVLASPLMIVMVLTDIVLVFIVRTAKGLQVYDVSILVRNLVVLVLAGPYFMFYIKFSERLWRSMYSSIDVLLTPLK